MNRQEDALCGPQLRTNAISAASQRTPSPHPQQHGQGTGFADRVQAMHKRKMAGAMANRVIANSGLSMLPCQWAKRLHGGGIRARVDCLGRRVIGVQHSFFATALWRTIH